VKSVADLRSEGFNVMVYVDRLPYAMGQHLTKLARTGHHIPVSEILEYAEPVVGLRKIPEKKKIWGFGGVTHMQVWEPGERQHEEGASPDFEVTAVCSVLDQFDKRLGHKICLSRLNYILQGNSLQWPADYQGHR
jgi:hypothetical protein